MLLYRRNVNIGSGVRINNKTRFEEYINIGKNAVISSSEIGRCSYIGERSILKNCRIGRFCSIGADVRILIGDHPSRTFVSTNPVFFSKRKQCGISFTDKQIFEELKYTEDGYFVEIGNDVWIGSNVMINQGVTIGDGAIIGAGSLILSDVEPYSVNVGIPAKTLRKRFNDEDIEFLLKLQWWDRSFNWIEKHSEYFDDIIKFRETVENEL